MLTNLSIYCCCCSWGPCAKVGAWNLHPECLAVECLSSAMKHDQTTFLWYQIRGLWFTAQKRILLKVSWIVLSLSVSCSFCLCPVLLNFFLLCCSLTTPKISESPFPLKVQTSPPCHGHLLHWDARFINAINILSSTSSVSPFWQLVFIFKAYSYPCKHSWLLYSSLKCFFPFPSRNFSSVRASLKSGSSSEQWWNGWRKIDTQTA